MQLPVCLHIIKTDISLWTKTCLKWHDDITKSSPCCNILLWRQIFAFCKLISNSVLGRFLLIIYKKHTLTRSTNLLSRNHLTLCFRLKRDGRQMSNTYCLTLSWRRPLSYRKQSIDLLRKSMDWFLYDNGHRHERVHFMKKNNCFRML